MGLAWLGVNLVGIADAVGITLAWLGTAGGDNGREIFAAVYRALFTALAVGICASALSLYPSTIKDATAKVLVGNVTKNLKIVIKRDVFLCTVSLHRCGSVMDVTNLTPQRLVIFSVLCIALSLEENVRIL